MKITADDAYRDNLVVQALAASDAVSAEEIRSALLGGIERRAAVAIAALEVGGPLLREVEDDLCELFDAAGPEDADAIALTFAGALTAMALDRVGPLDLGAHVLDAMLRMTESTDESAAALGVHAVGMLAVSMSPFEVGIGRDVSAALVGLDARSSSRSVRIQVASARDNINETGSYLLGLLVHAAELQDRGFMVDVLEEMRIEANDRYEFAASHVGSLSNDERVVEALVALSLALS